MLGYVRPIEGTLEAKSTGVAIVSVDGDSVQSLGGGPVAEDGYFSFAIRRTAARTFVIVRGDRFAPFLHEVRPSLDGEGIYLDELRPETGKSIVVEAIDPRAVEPTVELSLYPDFGNSTIDLDSEPLARVPFQSGVAVLPRVAPGNVFLVVDDRFKTMRPIVLPWRMGHRDVRLNPIAIERGERFTIDVAAAGEELLDAECRMGSGAWPIFGGPEIGLLWRPLVDQTTHGRFKIDCRNVPQSVARLTLHCKKRAGHVVAAPGVKIPFVELNEGVRIIGRIREDGGSAIRGAKVELGGRTTETDAAGNYSFDGVPTGRYALTVLAERYLASPTKTIVVNSSDSELTADFFLERPTVLVGVVESTERTPVPNVLVGFESDSALDGAVIGRPVFFVSDKEGKFRMTPVRAGSGQAYAVPKVGYGIPNSVTLAAAIDNRVVIDVAPTGEVLGRVDYASRRPAPGARVWLIDAAWPKEATLRIDFVERVWPWFARCASAGADGQFFYPALQPGSYHVVIDAPGRPRYYGGIVDVIAGKNPNGFNHIVGEREPRRLELPLGGGIRLRRFGDPATDEWIACGRLSTFIDISNVPAGTLTIERIADPRVIPNTPRFPASYRTDTFDDGKIELEILGGDETLTLRAKPEVRVRGVVNVGASGLDPWGVELTAYPIEGSRDQTPVRLAVNVKTGEFDVYLSRGVWLFRSVVPGFGSSMTGPIAVGTGLESETIDRLVVETPPAADLVSRIVNGRETENLLEDAVAFACPWWYEFVERWRPQLPHAAVAAGQITIDDVESPGGTLFVVGAAIAGQRPFDIAPAQSLKLAEVPIFLEAQKLRGTPAILDLLKSTSRDDWVLSSPTVVSRPIRDGTSAEFEFPERRRRGVFRRWDLLEFTDRAIAESIAVLVDHREATEWKDKTERRRRFRFNGRVALNGRRLDGADVRFLPVFGAEFDFDRLFVATSSRDGGTVRCDRLTHGDYSLALRYRGEDGRFYRAFTPIERTNAVDDVVSGQMIDIKTGRLHLRIVGASTEDAVPGAVVRLCPSAVRSRFREGAFFGVEMSTVDAIADEDGELVLDSVPAGLYDLKVSSDRFGVKVVRDVEIAAVTKPLQMTLRLPPRAVYEPIFLDAARRRVPGVRVLIHDAAGIEVLETRRFVSGTDGHAVVHGLSPDNWRATAIHPSGMEFSLGTFDLSTGQTLRPEIVCPKPGNLRVVVFDELGKRLERAHVTLRSGGMRMGNREVEYIDDESYRRTDVDGLYVAPPLGPGTWEVDVAAEGYSPKTDSVPIAEGETKQIEVILTRVTLK